MGFSKTIRLEDAISKEITLTNVKIDDSDSDPEAICTIRFGGDTALILTETEVDRLRRILYEASCKMATINADKGVRS